MECNCKVVHRFDNDEKKEVSDKFQSVSWNDGDIMMLAYIVKEEIGKQCIEKIILDANSL